MRSGQLRVQFPSRPLRVTIRENCKFIYVSDESENLREKAKVENLRIALSLRLVFELTTFKEVDWDSWRLTRRL